MAPRMRRLVLVVSLAVAAVGFAAVPATASPPAYAALGDSYAAGPFIPIQLQPYGCLKSSNNYAHLVAQRDGFALDDITCSGATTTDMTAPQNVFPDGPNPPQYTALTRSTAIVTLQIGGNDIGFSSIAESCASPVPTGTPCQDKYVVNGDDQLADRIAATAPKVRAAIDGIRGRAPHARVFVLGYGAILPEGPLVAGAPEGCWPSMPITPGDVPYLRNTEKELNAMIAAQAAAEDATYVDVYTPSIGHDACEIPAVRWIEPVVPASPAAPVHPNLLGMRADADLVAAAIAGA